MAAEMWFKRVEWQTQEQKNMPSKRSFSGNEQMDVRKSHNFHILAVFLVLVKRERTFYYCRNAAFVHFRQHPATGSLRLHDRPLSCHTKIPNPADFSPLTLNTLQKAPTSQTVCATPALHAH